MNAEALLAALDLPAGSRVDQRVPKKLLLENGAATAADKRYINEGIEEFRWIAALKPTTIGVPEYRDDVREYLEIAVLRLALRPLAKATRLVELVHRGIPYPVLLVTEQAARVAMSAAHKRGSQGGPGKVVLDDGVVTVSLSDAPVSPDALTAFTRALSLAQQPHKTLFALYQGWVDTAHALMAAKLTGTFKVATSEEQAAARRQALKECERLEFEMARLRTLARKEKQLSTQVKLNVDLKAAQACLIAAREQL